MTSNLQPLHPIFAHSEQISRYAVSVPRYTSYPSALEFTERFTDSIWSRCLHEYLENRPISDPIAIYLHLPFCPSLCYFCACTKVIVKNRSKVRPYLDALKREITHYGTKFEESTPPLAQIHWGGGSPSFLSPEEIHSLSKHLQLMFPRSIASPDISIELDPRTTSESHLAVLKSLQFNRLSFGVQDFAPHVQSLVHRIQPFDCVKRVFDSARRLGFQGINIDLIYGLPGQSVESMRSTIAQVLELRPDRIALYGYAHVTWISKAQKVFDRAGLPDSSTRVQLFICALRSLCEAGYEYIGMDHFALPSDCLSKARREESLNRNFMGYATHKTDILLGFGMSAISSIPTAFAQNHRTLELYQQRIQSSRLPTERGLRRSEDDMRRDSAIQAIMCQGKIDLNAFASEWKVSLDDAMPFAMELLAPMQADGLLIQTKKLIIVTPLGRFFLRNIASAFDAYLNRRRTTQPQSYSQAL